MDIIREVGKAFTLLDFITPWYTLYRQLKHHDHTFFVPDECGLSGADLADLLRRHGIRSRGNGWMKDMYYFSVSPEDAERAQQILDEARIPTAGDRPKPWQRREAQTTPQRRGWRERWGL